MFFYIWILVSCGQVLPPTKTIAVQKQGEITLKWTIVRSKGETPDWFSLYYQENNRSSIIPIWYDTDGLLDYGKSKFNGSLTINRPPVNRFEVTIENIEESMWVYLTVVFQNKAGAIVNGPIFSKYEIESKILFILFLFAVYLMM